MLQHEHFGIKGGLLPFAAISNLMVHTPEAASDGWLQRIPLLRCVDPVRANFGLLKFRRSSKKRKNYQGGVIMPRCQKAIQSYTVSAFINLASSKGLGDFAPRLLAIFTS
jgi:hypothetical protein